jgi:hypothetical protein
MCRVLVLHFSSPVRASEWGEVDRVNEVRAGRRGKPSVQHRAAGQGEHGLVARAARMRDASAPFHHGRASALRSRTRASASDDSLREKKQPHPFTMAGLRPCHPARERQRAMTLSVREKAARVMYALPALSASGPNKMTLAPFSRANGRARWRSLGGICIAYWVLPDALKQVRP